MSTASPLNARSPHESVSSTCTLSAKSPTDFDFSASLQFVSEGSATLIDFSTYAFIEDREDVENVASEIEENTRAFRALVEHVNSAYEAYVHGLVHVVELVQMADQSIPVG